MRRQLDFVLESGVSALAACGSAGESERQSLEEIEEVLGTVIDHVDGRRAERSRNDYVPTPHHARYLKATLRQPEVSSSPERGEVYSAYLPVCF